MVKGKKKNFVKFDEDSAKRAAQKKQEGGAASDKTTAQQLSNQSQVAKKPPKPPRNQHSFDNAMANDSAESMSHLSLQETDFPAATNSTYGANHAHLTFSPPPIVPDTPSQMPSWNRVLKGESKGTHRKEKSQKVETQTNLEPSLKGASLPNEHLKDTSEVAPHTAPTVKPALNILPEPTTENWVPGPTGPPVATPKPFGAGLDHPLTVSVPAEPLTVNVPSVSGTTTEMSVCTPSSATLNVDAPVFQPKSVQTMTEFVPPQPVETPVSVPEPIEYVQYEESTSHQQGYQEPIYQTEVPVPNAMVQPPEFYPNMTPVIPQPMFIPPEMAYAGFGVVSVPNSDVHHIPGDMAPTYHGPMPPDMQNSTPAWPHPPMYPHDDQMDPNRDSARGHRTVYSPGMPNRGYYHQQRYDTGRRNSGQSRYPTSSSAYIPARRDSRDSEASDSQNHQRGPPRQNNDRNYSKYSRPPKNDLPRPEFRPSNNNHNKNRDQNQLRPSEGGIDNQEKTQPISSSDDWDSGPTDGVLHGGEQQNHQAIAQNNYEKHQPIDTHFNATHSNDSSFNSSKVSPNWRDRGPTKFNPKDPRMGDKPRTKREDGRKPGTLDGWGEKDEEYNHWLSQWQDYQKFSNVQEVTGDLFQMPKEYSLAHCVAEDMRMGSGIAITFKRDFKKQDELLNQRAKPGGLAFIEHEGRFIYYLVTKKHSTGKPSYYTLWCSLKKMQEHIEKNNVKNLAMPRIGCGLDKLEWTMVKSMIQHIFEGVSVHITVCNFQQNDDQQPSSLPSPKYFSCKIVNAPYPICDIEQGTIIVFLSTETGHVSKEMQELDNKFHFLTKFREAHKKQGELFVHEDFQKNYVLCGCIVRKSPKDKLDFTSLAKCVLAINKYNNKLKTGENYIYVGFQTVMEQDYQEDNLNNRIITILINYLRKVDVYICEDKKREE